MIPRRVRLEGFLCYKESQEIRFDEGSLWMLSGLNGSGKSSVFDAVTFALFGQHRGGSQDAHELINKHSDKAVIEFEFGQEQQRFVAYRTIQRNKKGGARSTTQLFRLDGEQREPIEDTNYKTGFDRWIDENIGLTYDTFTSSVLLLQGKAEKLLDSTAKGRFEVLAGIVDLERYERLHRRADEEKKSEEADVERVRARLASVPEFDGAALEHAEGQITEAEAKRQAAEAEAERLQGVEFQARQWRELCDRLTAAVVRLQKAESVLADAAAIEADFTRLEDLRRVLPRLQAISSNNVHIEESERRTKTLTAERQRLNEQVQQLDHAREQTRQKVASLLRLIEGDERTRERVAGEFREAAEQLTRLKEYEQQEQEFGKVLAELKRLSGTDPDVVVAKAREECDALSAVGQAVPTLARLQLLRDELRKGREQEKAVEKARQGLQTRGEKLAAELKALEPQFETATREARQAGEAAAAARTVQQAATDSLESLDKLGDAHLCRHCGQPLTPGHLQEERKRRRKELGAAEARFKAANDALKAAAAKERTVREQFDRKKQEVEEARLEYRDQLNQAKASRQEVLRLQRDCGQAHAELAEPFRARVCAAPPDDWATTNYPTADDLEGLRERAAGIGAAREKLREAEQLEKRWSNLKSEEKTRKQGLERIRKTLPADLDAVRQMHTRLEAEAAGVAKSLAARKTEVNEAQKDLDRLGQERERARGELTTLDGKLETEEKSRELWRQAVGREKKELPESWRLTSEKVGLRQLNDWLAERERLEGQRTDERARELRESRLSLEALRLERADLEARVEQVPPEARAEPAEVVVRLQAARKALRDCDEELAKVRQQKRLLEGYRQQHSDLQKEFLAAEKRHLHAKTLAQLLGRDRLQLHLVRQAERQVVDHANAVLDRLSAGQLYLRLCGEADGDGTAAKALELEAYNRETGEKPINVAFLSGSQKFRVAVALAMGIGQYASRQHRPIESVIIDEGFGCLDRNNRQVMIQELQNLRGHLHCILLVSHQEEFAEAFTDGYHFELEDGSTRVRPFRR
jgi:DNA repair protein SbcC/Rad50